MASCLSMFSLKTIRILLEKNNVPFALQPTSARAVASKGPVVRAAAQAGPNIVALVDRFSDLPKELQSYLLEVGNVPGDSPDRVKALIIGGSNSGQQTRPAARTKKGQSKGRKKSR